MQSGAIARALAAGALVFGLEAGSAAADVVEYSWSGRVEPIGANPWGLSGDGSAVTPNDGTFFTLDGFVDRSAVDLDGTQNPDYAEFAPETVTLTIGGQLAAVSSAKFALADDEFEGEFDAVEFQAQVELSGVAMSFVAEVRLAASTFDLLSPAAPDLPPSFADTLPIQFGGAGNGGNSLVTIPNNSTVTGLLQICPATPSVAAVDWTTPIAGVANGIDVSVANLGSPFLNRFPLTSADFAAALLCSTVQMIDYETGSDWALTLSQPADALLVYAKFWRGMGGDFDTVTYQFDAPFTIVSGLTNASVSNGGTLLSLPASEYHDGILRFEGPISGLSVDTNSTTTNHQALTFAVVPEPGGAAVTSLAALLFLRRRFV
jgi:hypothetical protein